MGRPKRPTPEAVPLKVSVAARGALNRFDDAVRLHEMMGTYPPEEHDAIQRSYDRARLKLLEYLQY